MKTAVEFLKEKLTHVFVNDKSFNELFDQAKQMEKEQMIESYCVGCADITKDNSIFPRETSEQYYNETFKSE